jgi:four helix bundle protein
MTNRDFAIEYAQMEEDYSLAPDRQDVYQAAIELYALTLAMVDQLVQQGYRGSALDQFKRSGLAILLTVAERVGESSNSADSAYFHRSARASASECRALFGTLRYGRRINDGVFNQGRRLLDRIDATLPKL